MFGHSKNEHANAEISEKLNALKQEILVVTSNNIAGKNIKKTLGIVRGVCDTPADSKKEFNLAEMEALCNMLIEAKNIRANAVTDVKISTITYKNSTWPDSLVIYIGTAVITD
jgi:uncharacterized protein YbjQ (UPF0145 family)